MKTIKYTAGLFTFALFAVATAPAKDLAVIDATTDDRPVFNSDFPPALKAVDFQSDGKRLNGQIYLADGPGPHPTVTLLHGYPGNEKNMDLAQALRRNGFNVFTFHYRGAWGSEGKFSFANVVQDVDNALAMLRSRAGEYRIDVDRLILIGHSMGGFAALQSATRNDDIDCVSGIAAADIGAFGYIIENDTEAKSAFAADADTLQMLAGWTGEKAIKELLEKRDAHSLIALAPALAGKSVLLVAADQDEAVPVNFVHAPMVAAYTAEPTIKLADVILSGDHSFSWSRMALIHEVVNWANSCKG